MALVGIAPPRRSRGLPESTQREFDQWYEWLLRLQGFIGGLVGGVITISLNINTNDLSADGLEKASFVRLSSSAAVNITGVAADTGAFRRKTLVNVGSFNITLTNQDTGSSAANRFTIPGAISLTMLPKDSCDIWYDTDSSTWRPI
jgi:hypothetical protein